MRLLISSFPAWGHLLPMAPLAATATAAGDEVVVCSGPAFAGAIPSARFEPVGLDLPELIAENGRRTEGDVLGEVRSNVETGVALFTSTRVDTTLTDALAVAERTRPDVLVAEMWDFVAPHVAAQLGIPLVVFDHSPATYIDGALEAGLETTLAGRGLSRPQPITRIKLWPDWLQPEFAVPVEGLDIRADAYDRDDSAWRPARASTGRPAVLVTLGTAVQDRELLQRCVEAVLAADVDVIVTALPGDDPDAMDVDRARVEPVGFVPLARLLPAVSAVVTAGGSGTTIAGLRSGLPLVLLPQLANQPLIGEIVERLGAGLVSPDAEGLTAATQRVQREPAFRKVAGDAAGRLETAPGPALALDRMRSLLRESPAR